MKFFGGVSVAQITIGGNPGHDPDPGIFVNDSLFIIVGSEE